MKLRQARKILRRPRPSRVGTVCSAIARLERRARRWRHQARDVTCCNPRPTYTLRDLFRLADLEVGWRSWHPDPRAR